MASKNKDIQKLCSEIASSLEDHALIPFSEIDITSKIIEFHIKNYLKKIITDFFDK